MTYQLPALYRAGANRREKMTPAAIAALARGDIENFLVAATPGGIEAQEKAGQAALCASAQLPKPTKYHGNTQEQFEKIGIVFGAPVDDLFVSVTLPAGWKVQPTNHSMWSDLLDEQGRKRAGIFYKAAFYDRKAHMSLSRRYNVSGYLSCDENGAQTDDDNAKHYLTAITDGDKVIHVIGHRERRNYEAGDAHQREATVWLRENYPEWEEPTAYWSA